MTVPFKVETPEQLAALALSSVILDREMNAWQKYDDTKRTDVDVVWACPAYTQDFTSQELFDYSAGWPGYEYSIQPFVCIFDGKWGL